ncbi:MAG TPA: glycerate kinase [Nitrospirae bacterium]|nr:glycerate kinase [Nitrospirota bacterium]
MDKRKLLEELFYRAVDAVNPYKSMMRQARPVVEKYMEACGRMFVLAFGKAAPPMAKAIEEIAGDRITRGVVITKYGHAEGYSFSDRFRVFEAGHPVPDSNGIKATEEALEMLRGLKEDDLVIILISGGGSALFIKPVNGISLKDKMETTSLLLKAGADIFELNTVRKKLSRVKGGRLAEMVYPAKAVSFILSDVLGDRPDMIASGPTVADPTTTMDAVRVLRKYNLLLKVPEAVRRYLLEHRDEAGMGKKDIHRRVENIIIGSNSIALDAALKEASSRGLKAEIIDRSLHGEARDAGRRLAEVAIKRQREKNSDSYLCLLSGGETTVTVTGSGRGGRNTELALSFAIAINGINGISMLSAGTDGTDGPTDAAGAIVDGGTVLRGITKGLDPRVYLDNNDSYTFLKETGDLFITGPTGTNVMDIQIILIG